MLRCVVFGTPGRPHGCRTNAVAPTTVLLLPGKNSVCHGYIITLMSDYNGFIREDHTCNCHVLHQTLMQRRQNAAADTDALGHALTQGLAR
jgi:hypothetical protein